MKFNQIENLLEIEIPKELIEYLLEHYQKGNNEFLKENWDYVGNEIGKFIEVAFRIVQNKTLNQYTSMNEKLPIINEGFLKNFEQSNNADEEYRIIIPRVLYSMYCIRNKRGMIHINNINPNRMDALYLINSSKWILAEIIRTTSNIDFEIAMQLIDDILHKTIPYVWRNNDTVRVLNTKLNVKEKILYINKKHLSVFFIYILILVLIFHYFVQDFLLQNLFPGHIVFFQLSFGLSFLH